MRQEMADKVVTVEIKGLDELEQRLYDLPTKYAKRVMQRALKAANLWLEEIRANARVLTGWMKDHAKLEIRLSAREESGTAMVGFTKEQNPERHGEHVPSAANEAFWTELGTVHQPARPFIRPAFDAKASAVLAEFTAVAREELDNFNS
jgi:HK97 gp10 family phage protein